jgi:Fur family peroxide stress response transcriptional regulator
MTTDSPRVEHGMQELVRRCRDRGMNVTPQRAVIYRTLLESDDHPSPEALYRRVHPKMPSLSLATIYKALDALVGLGLAREVDVAGGTQRYDANLDRHHHLICTKCRKVIDFVDPNLDAVHPPRRLKGFVARTVSVQVFGLCPACATSPRSRSQAGGDSLPRSAARR